MPNQYGALGDRGTTKALQVRFSLPPDYGLTLSPEVAPVVTFDMPELLFHQGWRRYGSFASQGAVAAQFARFRLRNPATSTLVVKVNMAILAVAAAWDFCAAIGFGTADLTTVVGGATGAGVGLDTRQGSQLGGVAIFSKQTDAAAQTPQLCDLFTLANTPQALPYVPVLLWPGTFLDLFIQQANTLATCQLEWHERLIQEQENTP